ncbi:protein ABHD18 [Adelges cooleyi]|uniref:protein ABHD18 n=1 Tax=Adelges cooleyi TaxID=133065 RepID=UPI00217F6D65|nr:protein ABHD18 [Adelges cooleyi]
MIINKFDYLYRKLLLTKYFVNGWGDPEKLKSIFEFRKYIVNRDSCNKLVPTDYPVKIVKKKEDSDSITFEGVFESPFFCYLPTVVPRESHLAHFQLLLPKKWRSINAKPICLHMAGTGDQYYWRRRAFLANPLLKEAGIGSIILENPFYGKRKPSNQVRSTLCNVSDIFVMGGCLILESLVLFNWCEREGFGPLGVTGLSMGGHMASLAAASWPKPVVLVPCLSGTTASGVFTEGAMSCAIDWNLLEQQYKSNATYKNEIVNVNDLKIKVNHLNREFNAGKQFIKNLNSSSSSDIQSKLMFDTVKNKKAALKLYSSQQLENLKTTKSFNSFDNLDDPTIEEHNKMQIKSDAKKMRHMMRFFNEQSKNEDLNLEALSFMKGIMDECTHLRNFNIPVDMDLVIAVCAKRDGYVPQKGVARLEDVWPGAEVRYVDTGHVAAFLLHRNTFKNAIIEAFHRAQHKYFDK